MIECNTLEVRSNFPAMDRIMTCGVVSMERAESTFGRRRKTTLVERGFNVVGVTRRIGSDGGSR